MCELAATGTDASRKNEVYTDEARAYVSIYAVQSRNNSDDEYNWEKLRGFSESAAASFVSCHEYRAIKGHSLNGGEPILCKQMEVKMEKVSDSPSYKSMFRVNL